jgi:outer membrane protein OmpA-like peptidoglycan-associated protein
MTRARRGAAPLAALALVLGLAACSSAEASEPTTGIAFVVGARSNMPPPALNGQAVTALEEAVDAGAVASLVVADGEPESEGTTKLVVSGANSVAREKSRTENLEKIANAFDEVRAQDEESDLLTALSLAERTVREVDGKHAIVVVDSGLSTTGPLDFTQPGMLEADPAEVVAMLQAAKTLPDLSGVTVTVQGLGDTADPQQRLSIAQRDNLIAIWQAVLTAAGAERVVIEETPLTGTPAAGLPLVTPIALPVPVVCETDEVVLTGGDVAFEPDSAVFRDPAGARAVLEPIAAQLVTGDVTATVTGMTADVGPLGGQVALSRERAGAVVAVLEQLGVQPGALTADGVGSDFPGYVQDHGPDGELLPAQAAANRKVTITPVKGALVCD